MLGHAELQAFSQVMAAARTAFNVEGADSLTINFKGADHSAKIVDFAATADKQGKRVISLDVAGKLPEPNMPPPIAVGCKVGKEICELLRIDPTNVVNLLLNVQANGAVTATVTKMMTVEQVKGVTTGPLATLASEWAVTLTGRAEPKTETITLIQPPK